MQTAGQGGGVGDTGESETSQDDRRRLTIIVIGDLLLLLFLLLLFLSSVYVAGMGGSDRESQELAKRPPVTETGPVGLAKRRSLPPIHKLPVRETRRSWKIPKTRYL